MGPAQDTPASRRPSAAGTLLFDAAYLLILPFLTVHALWSMAVRGRHRRSFPGKWGVGLARATRGVTRPSIWVHAVSVGEVRAAKPLVAELARRFPSHSVVLTTTTETGLDTARELYPGSLVWWFPFDLSVNVRRWFRRLRPVIVIIVELDLWPNVVRLAARRGVPVAAVNAKLSDRSCRRYQSLLRGPLAPLIHAMWRPLRLVCVQTDLDRERMAPLVPETAAIHVTGNIKLDFPSPQISAEDRAAWRRRLRVREDQALIVAGSTHAGEEALLLSAVAAVRQAHPGVHLLLVPRHPERFAEVAGMADASGLGAQRWTSPASGAVSVTVVDTMGVLLGLYSLATVAVVCGSFVPVGGHNILEPAQFGVPVVFGPHTHAQRGLVKLLLEAGGGHQVTADKLAETLTRLLADPSECLRLGQAGREAVLRNQGSTARCLDLISPLIR
ncbi:MAG: 3-deoxy-D-manno-octulosonic acid transferase [Candidatus Sumerlaeia bacterium]|nr:3-deoxy-D-manno-octulosonic acid transferase [Candidatus Sumerlaeia bacterium]